MVLISLMSLGSNTCSCQKLKRLGKTVLGRRSSTGMECWSYGVMNFTLRVFATPLLQYSITPLLHFHIIDETDDYAVVDKPPFLLIHPTKPDGTRTLWKELRRLFAFEIAAGGQVSIINRLDRETSGLVLVAKKADVARRFGVLMQRRQLKKRISGHRPWLGRMGKHSRRCRFGSTRQASTLSDLAQTNDSPIWRAGADGV
jgi:hypothetical protein